MKMNFCSLLAGALLLALSGTTHAGQPLALSDNQMDAISAGANATADATAMAMGDAMTITTVMVHSITITDTLTFGGAFSQASAASTFSLLRHAAATGFHSLSAGTLAIALFLLAWGPSIVVFGGLLYLGWRGVRRVVGSAKGTRAP